MKTDDRKLKSVVVDPVETRGKKGEPLKIESVCASVTKPDKDVSNLPQIPKANGTDCCRKGFERERSHWEQGSCIGSRCQSNDVW